jgi:murein L,D-transpeptidase YcbB/YkuD
MKKRMPKLITSLLFVYNFSQFAFAQITTEKLEQYISNKKIPNSIDTRRAVQITAFYENIKYKTAWINETNKADRAILFNDLKQSSSLGLREADYQYGFIEALTKGNTYLQTTNDSLEAEILITDAAIQFYNDVVSGNTKPSLSFNGIDEVPECQNIPMLLAEYIERKKLLRLQKDISPGLKEVAVIENKITWIESLMAKDNFKEVIVTSNKVNAANEALLVKLYQLGITNEANIFLKDTSLISKVKEAQKQFVLMTDGVLRKTVLEELNVPLSKRLTQLKLALNYYRWLSCFSQHRSTIVVNIPAAYLKVYKDDNIELEMRMIVGKKTTPTPTLLSTINEVILYPYWHVPYSIATKELLPHIKQSASFIDKGNYQVLNGAGKIMDPYAINWRALSESYFPYTIRQSTGCDNALGLLKLNFYSPDGVYLHDTPAKNLFSLNKRYFSHGCMRMEKPIELGHLVVKNNMIAIDTLSQKGCLKNQAPIIVHADVHMPVLVWYNPVGIDEAGRVLFFEDVYGKFEHMK